MTSHAILDPAEHRDLRVRDEPHVELGDGVMACLTVPLEFRRVQADFPILYRRDPSTGKFMAVALLGFEEGENLFLENGRWDADYRPLSLSIQPFLVGRPQSGDGPSQVHIDLSHPRIAGPGEGIRVFDEVGSPTPYLTRIADQLGDLDQGYAESADYFAALERHGLLEPLSLDVELNDGSKHRLVGYHIVNEHSLEALGPDALGDLHSSGHLVPMFMAMASLSNLTDLARRKNRRMGFA